LQLQSATTEVLIYLRVIVDKTLGTEVRCIDEFTIIFYGDLIEWQDSKIEPGSSFFKKIRFSSKGFSRNLKKLM